ncbi:hypothetical protein BGX20_007345 [Mortierella sp. AD010]|nr:hypothetical protein BGX20_007345 [Mortierella sp. AD010]
MTTPTPQGSPEHKKPHVLIVGAGLAGLLLGILLDRQGVSYEIFERSSKVKPLGAVMSLNANILPAIEQLGLLDALKAVSFPSRGFHIYSSDMKLISAVGSTDDALLEKIGYDYQLFARFKFYDILLSHIAPEKIHFNKKITSISQDDKSATITCDDGTTYSGDILVGADGTYSAVRQGLYQQMQEENLLPESDTKSMSKGYICLVGTTNPMDPEKYPVLKNDTSILYQVIGEETQYTWSAVIAPENRICWNAVLQLTASQEDNIQNAEWGPEANESMIKEVRDFKVPIGGTLGDLIDSTPKETISRVFLEDKIFETWSHNRVVLIGDACHKLLPSAGQGAVNAMQDSVILANCIYDLESLSTKDISAALKDYRDQRFPYVIEQYEASKINAKIIYGQTFLDRLIRKVILNYMPKSIQAKSAMKNLTYRPQATFLPLAPKHGTSPVLPQKPSKRYQAIAV